MRSVSMLATVVTVLSVILFSCQSVEEVATVPFVNPPFPALNPEFHSFTFKVEEGLSVELENGSTVIIPANALMDRKGQEINGEVTANYRELHDGLSIYLAGVPMEYAQGDSSWQFSTAGTFELRVRQNEEAVYLKSGEKASVKMASYVSEKDYPFFYLDETGRKWDSLGMTDPEINEEKVLLKKKIKGMRPGLKFPLNRTYMAFNYDALADVFYKNKKVGEEMHQTLLAKLKKYGLGWNNVFAWEMIDFRGRKEPAGLIVWKNISKKNFPEWTNRSRAKLRPIKGKNNYMLEMHTKDSSQTFQCKIKAVMTLKSLFAFSPEYWANNYKAAMQKIEEEEQRLAEMADVYRHFEVGNLGIYNWDIIMKNEEVIPLQANFNFNMDYNKDLTIPDVIYITSDRKSVIKYKYSDWERFMVWPEKGGFIFSILPGMKVCLFSEEEYQKIDFKALKENPDPEFLFEMTADASSFNTREELIAKLGM